VKRREKREREREREREGKNPNLLCFSFTFFFSLFHHKKKRQISPEKAIFMFVKNVLPPTGTRKGGGEKKAEIKEYEISTLTFLFSPLNLFFLLHHQTKNKKL